MAMVVGVCTDRRALSPAEPVSVEGTTTTSTTPELEPPVEPESFSVDQIARGEALDWERVAEPGSGHAIALTVHDGDLLMFPSSSPAWKGEPGGLFVWKSEDGQGWKALGEAIDEGQKITDVVPAGGRLVATGTDPDLPGFVADLSSVEWGIQPTRDGVGLTTFGPLATPALSATRTELGMSDDELEGNRRVVLLAVGSGHVAAVAVDVGEWISPDLFPGFEISSAEIP